jgi:hypothetical protein
MERINAQINKSASQRLFYNFNYPEYKNKGRRKNKAVDKNPLLQFRVQLFGIAWIIIENAHFVLFTESHCEFPVIILSIFLLPE